MHVHIRDTNFKEYDTEALGIDKTIPGPVV